GDVRFAVLPAGDRAEVVGEKAGVRRLAHGVRPRREASRARVAVPRAGLHDRRADEELEAARIARRAERLAHGDRAAALVREGAVELVALGDADGEARAGAARPRRAVEGAVDRARVARERRSRDGGLLDRVRARREIERARVAVARARLHDRGADLQVEPAGVRGWEEALAQGERVRPEDVGGAGAREAAAR